METNKQREIYTDKNFLDMTDSERDKLKARLKAADYYDDDGVHVAKTRASLEDKNVMDNELRLCKILHALGHEVYLLPPYYAYDEKEKVDKTSCDTLTDNEFLEIKTVNTSHIKDAYKKARKQAKDMAIEILSDISKEDAINDIYGSIRLIKKSAVNKGHEIDFSSRIYIHFGKANNTILLELDNTGTGHETSPSFMKIPDKNRITSTKTSIPQNKKMSSENTTKSHARQQSRGGVEF